MAYIPNPQSYIGNQIILNSDRLLFNAKTDSILLYSDKVIGFSTNGNFHFDTSNDKESSFIVNSPNIYLGLESDNTLPTQPAVLSDDLIESLEDICDAIRTVYSDMVFQISYITGVGGKPTGINPKNFKILNKRSKQLDKLIESLQNIKSDKIKLV
tara:strand:+ start:196 stop:663 length:468 start_codon:yes stop_codon:yes gene_type:complete